MKHWFERGRQILEEFEDVAGIGLEELRAAANEGECPFCLDPIPASKGRPRKHCGDEHCDRAYQRYYHRDYRTPGGKSGRQRNCRTKEEREHGYEEDEERRTG